jgi:hypothetical protein
MLNGNLSPDLRFLVAYICFTSSSGPVCGSGGTAIDDPEPPMGLTEISKNFHHEK